MKVALLLVAAIAVATEAGAQAQFRGDAAHTGFSTGVAPRQFHRVRWSFPTGDRVVSSPAWSNGVLFFGSDDGWVYAVDAQSGRQRWRFRTGGPVPASPAVAGGIVYVGSYDGKFYALDETSGELVWKFATEGERRFEARGLHGFLPKNQTIADPFDVFLSSPLIADGAVVFGSGDAHIYALDAASGALRWKVAAGDVVHASPAYADGLVFVGDWASRLLALDIRTGAERWRFQAGTDELLHNQVGFQSSPAVADGVVYVGCRDANLYAIDARTGREKWHFSTAGSWVVTSPAIARGRVIFATSDTSLYHVLDAATGQPVLQEQASAYMFSSPTVAADTVLIGLLNGTLEARDLASGALLWDFRTPASLANEGWVLRADRRFNAAMLFPSLWREKPAVAVERQSAIGSFYSSPLVVGGVVYVGSADGRLYAID